MTHSPAVAAARTRLLLQGYILGIPLWWVLGIDFIVVQGLAALLVVVCLTAHRRFSLSDHLLAATILSLCLSAYLGGFLQGSEHSRFVAALYNLSFWVCGLILVQQVRHILVHDPDGRMRLLWAGHVAFLMLVACGWGAVALAYAVGDLSLITPSVFGLLVGDRIPDSAPHIQRHAWLVFTLADWGLPGVPMPRMRVFGPYPAATAATVAALGTLSLLYVAERHGRGLRFLVLEAVVPFTLALTLTRSSLGGWVMGFVLANLLFGTIHRRLTAAAVAVMAGGMVLLGSLDVGEAASYRQYSSESRFENYAEAVERTLDLAPILGLGIKPREESHIALGSHSTYVSVFTKGGILGLLLATAYLVLLPAARWTLAWMMTATGAARLDARGVTELRILLTLQVATWVWLGFEDLDAPATAAALLFIGMALIGDGTGRTLAGAGPRAQARPGRPLLRRRTA
ncbi:hypothetical protein [Caenispirillum bisanense]|uniref:O-Antigen ligase n=1 Tax=Caenispirillum bisanense TaxID=414052 RepID=A0A286GD09_9PROT|nr:hypothetical protein [Caenispirillum bisanense]SOD93425.1 hypothetical protein SAMN05421508_10365 [Caenispirillum bisanense]